MKLHSSKVFNINSIKIIKDNITIQLCLVFKNNLSLNNRKTSGTI